MDTKALAVCVLLVLALTQFTCIESESDLVDSKGRLEDEVDPVTTNNGAVKDEPLVGQVSSEKEKITVGDTEDNKEDTAKDELNEEVVEEVVELTEEEKRAQDLYDSAMGLMNSSNPEKKKAYTLLIDAADLGHTSSQELVAKVYLFGDLFGIDHKKAFSYYKQLSLKGNAVGQLVRTSDNAVLLI